MLNSKDWTVALLAKSRQWRDPGNHRGPNYIPESLEAKLEATLNVIPAYTRYVSVVDPAPVDEMKRNFAARPIHRRSWS
jgi:hypothetical protein